jgi:glycosyltransferase involved in cell wall biosynthesis
VRRAGLTDRVEILAAPADVPATLSRVHAAVVLAEGPTLVKAYPHSLLEALATGRPVVVSEALPMADHVRATGCGVVAQGVSSAQVVAALAELIEGYARYRLGAAADGARAFSRAAMLDAYATLYEEVAGPPTP